MPPKQGSLPYTPKSTAATRTSTRQLQSTPSANRHGYNRVDDQKGLERPGAILTPATKRGQVQSLKRGPYRQQYNAAAGGTLAVAANDAVRVPHARTLLSRFATSIATGPPARTLLPCAGHAVTVLLQHMPYRATVSTGRASRCCCQRLAPRIATAAAGCGRRVSRPAGPCSSCCQLCWCQHQMSLLLSLLRRPGAGYCCCTARTNWGR